MLFIFHMTTQVESEKREKEKEKWKNIRIKSSYSRLSSLHIRFFLGTNNMKTVSIMAENSTKYMKTENTLFTCHCWLWYGEKVFDSILYTPLFGREHVANGNFYLWILIWCLAKMIRKYFEIFEEFEIDFGFYRIV